MQRAFTFFTFLILLALIAFVHPLWATTYAYIPSYGNDRVIRVNTDTEEFSSVDLTADGAESCGPYGAAVTPDGNWVLVTCALDDSLAVLSGTSFSSAVRYPSTTGAEPRGVAIEPGGRYAYVANSGDDTVSIINTATRSLRENVDVGHGPWGIAAVTIPGVSDDDTTRVYVANHDDNTVSVLTDDGSDVSVQTIASVGNYPVGVAASPNGQFVFVASDNGGSVGSVAVISTSTNAVTRRITVGDGAWGVAVGALGDYVYVTNRDSDTVSVIDAGTITVIGAYAVGDLPQGIAAPKNGDFAYAVTAATDYPITQLAVNTVSSSVTTSDIAQNTDHPIDTPYALGAFIGGTPPAAPSDLSATSPAYDRIELTWTDNSTDELGFKIERRILDKTAYEEIALVDADQTSYTDDSGVVANTTYEYRIRSYNEAADSGYATLSEGDVVTTEDGGFSWCFIGTLVH